MSRAGNSYENDDTRTWRRKYSLGRSASSTTGRPLSLAVNSEPPSSIIKNIGTQTALSSTMPMRRSGKPIERAVQDEVGARERGRRPEEHGLERRQAEVVGLRVPRVVERVGAGRRRGTPASRRCRRTHARSGRGRDVTADDRRRAPARPSRAARRRVSSRPSSRVQPVARRAACTCATGCTRPSPSVATGRAPTVPRGHVRGERGEVGVERALPEQTEVREHDRLVDTHLGRAGRRAPTRPSSRAEARRRSSTRRAARRGCVRDGRRAPTSDPGTARRPGRAVAGRANVSHG